jgi:putative hydrolase of the HAD superfamily
LEQLQVSPKESIFVGDHPVNDVKAAQTVGIKGIWKRDSQWNDVEADFIIEDLAQIPSIVRKLNTICYQEDKEVSTGGSFK